MSRAVIYERFGGPEVLELREVPEPHAGPGEVRVRVTAAGLNPMDWGIAARPELAARFGITVPSGFGSDLAGVVDEVGDGATGFAMGDRVYGAALGRAVADFVVVRAPCRCAAAYARGHQRRGGEHARGGRRHCRRCPGGDRPAIWRHRPDRRRGRRRGRVRRTARGPRRRDRDRHRLAGHLRVPAAARRRAGGLRPRAGGPGTGAGTRRGDRGDGPVRHRDGRGRAGARRAAGADLDDRRGPQSSRRRARHRRLRRSAGCPPAGSPTRSSPASSPSRSPRPSRSRRSATPSPCRPDATSTAKSWSRCDHSRKTPPRNDEGITMKRIQYHQYGGPEVMRLEDFEPAPPGADEVLVRVRAAGANPMDFVIRAGRMKMVTGRRFPRAMGYDFAGVVEAVGDRVTRLRVGDEVLGGPPMKSAGAFADVVVTQEKRIVKKPANLSFEDAAALPTVGVTALQAVITHGKAAAGPGRVRAQLPRRGRPRRRADRPRAPGHGRGQLPGYRQVGSTRPRCRPGCRLRLRPRLAHRAVRPGRRCRRQVLAAGQGRTDDAQARRAHRQRRRLPGEPPRSALPGPFHALSRANRSPKTSNRSCKPPAGGHCSCRSPAPSRSRKPSRRSSNSSKAARPSEAS